MTAPTPPRNAKTLRIAGGFGLRQIAAMLHVSYETVRRFEDGDGMLREDVLYRYRDAVARRLKRSVSLDELLAREATAASP